MDLTGVAADVIVTQLGDIQYRHPPMNSPFRCRPFPYLMAKHMVLLVGRLTPGQALAAQKPELDAGDRLNSRVRHTSVERLRAAGFTVSPGPGKFPGATVHVEFSGDWHDDVCRMFHECWPEGGAGAHE